MEKKDICRQVFNYETWISSGCPNDFPISMRSELRKLATENFDSYTYYRNFLFRECLIYKNFSEKLKSFLMLLEPADANEYHSKLIKHYRHAEVELNKFIAQRDNTFQIGIDLDSDDIIHQVCYLYQTYYEIELILLALASFVKLKTDGIYDVSFKDFRDRNNRLIKGRIIKFLSDKLIDFSEFKSCFDSAYDSKLRNTIGHNNYKISNNRIVSLDGSIVVERDEIFDSIENLQHINNFLIYFFSNIQINQTDLKTAGLLSVGFKIDQNKMSILVFQLSCFYELEKDKSWLEFVSLNASDENLETSISNYMLMKGPLTPELREAVQNFKKNDIKNIDVAIVPISPFPCNNCQELNLDCGLFFIQEADENILKVKLQINV